MEVDKIHRPKRSKVLPNVLSRRNKLILNAHSNIKHKMMFIDLFCGLRCGIAGT
jgi:integrase/recombinase XerD